MKLTRCIPLLTLVFVFAPAADHAPGRAQPTVNAESIIPVYLINTAMHTGFDFEMAQVPEDLIAVLAGIRLYPNVDIGWGQEEYYQDPEFTVSKAAHALFVPSTSVLRIEAYAASIPDAARWSDTAYRIDMNRSRFIRLCAFIDRECKHDAKGMPILASQSYNGAVRFYKGNSTYYLFNTCNTWCASALKYAGYPISTAGVVTARELFRRVKEFGVEVK